MQDIYILKKKKDGKGISRYTASHVMSYFYGTIFMEPLGMLCDNERRIEALNLELRPYLGLCRGDRWDRLFCCSCWLLGGTASAQSFTAVLGIQEDYPFCGLKDIKIQPSLPQVLPWRTSHARPKATSLDDLACFALLVQIVPLCPLS